MWFMDLFGKLSPVQAVAIWFGGLALVSLFGKLLREHVFIPRMTILQDLPNIGKSRTDGKIAATAVVCGGSVSGLIAAAVCADHYESVIVVEPEASAVEGNGLQFPVKNETRVADHCPTVAVAPRKRVVQWYGSHIFFPLLYDGLRILFPGLLRQEMKELGPPAIPCRFRSTGIPDPFEDTFGKDGQHVGQGPLTFPYNREGFEILLRRLLRKGRPNIQFMHGTVNGLKRAEGTDRISDVLVRSEEGKSIEIPTHLVVDATGPVQGGYYKWLKAAGFPALSSDIRLEYDADRVTLTVILTIPDKLVPSISTLIPWGWTPGLVLSYIPDRRLGENRGMVWNIGERNQLFLSIGGTGFKDRPYTASAYRDAVRAFPGNKVNSVPRYALDILDWWVKHEGEVDSAYADIAQGRFSWIQYHKAPAGSLPANFVVVGDAMMQLNPSGGQGCSKALVDAVCLDVCLRKLPSNTAHIPSGFSAQYFKKEAPRVKGFWVSNKDIDYSYPATIPVKGETLAVGEFRRQYRYYSLKLCAKDRDAWSTIWDAACMLAPGTDVFTPWIAWRVAKLWVKDRVLGMQI